MSNMAPESYDRYLDKIRRSEYPQLNNTVYLDHAGTTLYANSLVESFATDMKVSLFGNPHSACPSSKLSSDRVNHVRLMVLDYLKADPDHFDVVFVANATAAIKTILQGFDARRFWYGYHKDAHTSLVGVRELAKAGSACFASDKDLESWIHLNSVHVPDDDTLQLVAWPAQSNLTGYRPPMSWVKNIRDSEALRTNKTYTLLDAASYLCTGALDLSDSETAPDFTVLSFYKIFGFPDLGALIVRKEASDILLERPYFGGGTVDMVVGVDLAWHAMKIDSIHDVLEDGTLPFHNIIALHHAFDVHKRLFGSPLQISRHVARLGEFAYRQLSQLTHYNGVPVVHIYKESTATFGDSKTQGPIISLNIRDSSGRWIGKSRVEKLAIACGIQFRTGGVCNPGGIATMLKLKPWEMRRNFSIGMTCGDDLDVLAEKPTGVVRISFGAMTSFQDIEYFVRFLQTFFMEGEVASSSKHLAIGKEDTSLRQIDLKTSTYIITPIESLPPCTVALGSFRSLKEAYVACSIWDKEWCLIDTATRNLHSIDGDKLSQISLKILLDPEKGTLTITSWSKPCDASVRTKLKTPAPTLVNRRVTIDLWQLSDNGDNATVYSDCPMKDIPIESVEVVAYTHPDVQEFFSKIAGIPCTLARRKDQHKIRVKKEAQTCAVWWCKTFCGSLEALEKHYSWHRTEWCTMTTKHGTRSDLKAGSPLGPHSLRCIKY